MKRALRRQGGFITAMGMLVAIVLFVIGLGLLSLGFNRRMTSARAGWQTSARCAADYAVAKAVYQMNEKLDAPTWDGSTLPAEENVTVPDADARYSYTVTGSLGSGYSLQATGESGTAEKTILCDLRLKGPFDYAILTRSWMNLINSSRVDSINYHVGDGKLKIGTTSILPGMITLKSGSIINGDILIGQGGIPSVVVDDFGATHGTIYPVATDFEITMPAVPGYLAAMSSNPKIDGPEDAVVTGKYPSIDLKNGEVITIDSDVEIYVTGDIKLDHNARIDVSATNPDAKLTIYLAGSFDGLNGAGFNNLNDPNSAYPAGNPHKLTVYGLSSCTGITIKNDAVFCGTIYAPNANVDLHNSADIYGSVVANTFIQRNSANFWYDASLREVTVEEEFTRFVPVHWREQ